MFHSFGIWAKTPVDFIYLKLSSESPIYEGVVSLVGFVHKSHKATPTYFDTDNAM